jgi:hypothetical protein
MPPTKRKKAAKSPSRTSSATPKMQIDKALRAIGKRLTKLEKAIGAHNEHLQEMQSDGFIRNQSETILDILQGELRALAHRFDQGMFSLPDLIDLMNNSALRHRITMVGSELVKARSAGSPIPITSQDAISSNFRK